MDLIPPPEVPGDWWGAEELIPLAFWHVHTPGVLILGDPRYYYRFGLRNSEKWFRESQKDSAFLSPPRD